MKVLVVEDECLIAMMLEDILDDMGHTVIGTFGTFETGLVAATTLTMDFATLDLNLDGKLSYPIARVLQKRNIPFLFMSGYHELHEPGFESITHLTKPVPWKALEAAIARAMDRAEASVLSPMLRRTVDHIDGRQM